MATYLKAGEASMVSSGDIRLPEAAVLTFQRYEAVTGVVLKVRDFIKKIHL